MQPDVEGTSSNKHSTSETMRRCCTVELQTEATSPQPGTVISIMIVETNECRVGSDDGHCSVSCLTAKQTNRIKTFASSVNRGLA